MSPNSDYRYRAAQPTITKQLNFTHKCHIMIDVLPTLVVDSDQACLEFTSNLLTREGHTCTCVRTTDEATVSISEGSFGLVVADTRMPGNEELQLVKKVQDITERLPFILVADNPAAWQLTEAVWKTL